MRERLREERFQQTINDFRGSFSARHQCKNVAVRGYPVASCKIGRISLRPSFAHRAMLGAAQVINGQNRRRQPLLLRCRGKCGCGSCGAPLSGDCRFIANSLGLSDREPARNRAKIASNGMFRNDEAAFSERESEFTRPLDRHRRNRATAIWSKDALPLGRQRLRDFSCRRGRVDLEACADRLGQGAQQFHVARVVGV